MIGQPLLTVVMVTIALSLVIRGLMQIVYGPQERTLGPRSRTTVTILGVQVSTLDLIVMAITAVCVTAFALFFRVSKLGLQMRATAESAEASVLSGIDANRVFMLAFGIGTATAALGGVLMANLQVVSPQLGALGLLAFPAAVIGGLTSIPGAVVGGLVIGVVEQLATGYIDGAAANVVVYGALLLMLLLRPYGLFGEPESGGSDPWPRMHTSYRRRCASCAAEPAGLVGAAIAALLYLPSVLETRAIFRLLPDRHAAARHRALAGQLRADRDHRRDRAEPAGRLHRPAVAGPRRVLLGRRDGRRLLDVQLACRSRS